ncbi:MAG: hypothetical protein IJ302_02200 [Clostridia bacterium]|nr:hypothetical protein [Clostridia bacterium]
MKHRKLLPALLLALAFAVTACNRNPGEDISSDTVHNTDTDTQRITETETAAPDTTTPPTETLPPETLPPETEPLPETETETEPLPETEILEIPAETAAPDTTAVPGTTAPAAPPIPDIEIPKPVIDITEQFTADGAPVTGQLSSAQSEHIRLLVDYSIGQAEDGTIALTLEVGLSCYELWCSAKSDMGEITVNGVSRTFSTEAIDHPDRTQLYIPFFTQTYNCTGSQTASIDVRWAFNGTYGGTDIGTLTTGAILQWDLSAIPVPAPTDPQPEEILPEVPQETVPAAPGTEAPTPTEPLPQEPLPGDTSAGELPPTEDVPPVEIITDVPCPTGPEEGTVPSADPAAPADDGTADAADAPAEITVPPNEGTGIPPENPDVP